MPLSNDQITKFIHLLVKEEVVSEIEKLNFNKTRLNLEADAAAPATPPPDPAAAPPPPAAAAPGAPATPGAPAVPGTPPVGADGLPTDPAAPVAPPGALDATGAGAGGVGADGLPTDPNADPALGAEDPAAGGSGFGGFGGGGGGGGGGGAGDDAPPGEGDPSGAGGDPDMGEPAGDPIKSMVDSATELLDQTQDPGLILKSLKGQIQALFAEPEHALGLVKALYDTKDLVLQSVAQRLYLFIKTSGKTVSTPLELSENRQPRQLFTRKSSR